MDEVPSNAAIANQKAHYDGVNPYTSEPIQPSEPVQQNQSRDYFVPIVMTRENQEPASEFPNTGGQRDQLYQDTQNTQNTQGFNQYNDVVAAEEFNRGRSQEPQANGAADEKAVNTMTTNFEGFPILGGTTETNETASVSERELLTDDTDDEKYTPVRPTDQTTRKESVQTISNLHIPGGYPKSTPV